MVTRQSRSIKLAAAIAAVAIECGILAVFLTPAYFPGPPREHVEAPTIMVLVPSLSKPTPKARTAKALTVTPLSEVAPALLQRAPPALTAITPPASAPDAKVLGAIAGALGCDYTSLASLPPEQRAVCEKKLMKSRLEPAAPFAHTARQEIFRAHWDALMAEQHSPPVPPFIDGHINPAAKPSIAFSDFLKGAHY